MNLFFFSCVTFSFSLCVCVFSICPARREAEFLNVIFAVARRRRHHDFGDEIDNGRGRLFGFEFSKDVTLVIRLASRFTSDKSEATTIY